MDSKKMMKEKTADVLQGTKKEISTVEVKHDVVEQGTDQQEEKKSFVDQIHDLVHSVPGTESAPEELIDTSDVEVEISEKDIINVVQDSAAFRNMSTEAEQRKEYFKDGQQMPENMQQEYKEEFRQAKKEENSHEAPEGNRSEEEERERKNQERLQRARETMQRTKQGIMDAWRSLQSSAELEAVSRGIMGDRDSASESFERMRGALENFIFMTDDENREPDAYIDAIAELREASQAYYDSHSTRRRFTGKGKRRKGYSETLIRILSGVEREMARNYMNYKKSRMEATGMDDAVYQEQVAVTKARVFGDQDETQMRPADSLKQVEELAKYGSTEKRLECLLRLGYYKMVSSKFGQELEKYGYEFDMNRYSDSVAMLGDSFRDRQSSRIVKVRMAAMVDRLKTAGTQALFDTYNRYLAEDTIPQGMSKDTYAKLKLQNSIVAYRQMALPVAVQDSMFADDDIAELMQKTQLKMPGDMARDLAELNEYGTEVSYKYKRVVEQAREQYLDVTQEMQMVLFWQLLGSGMLIRTSDKKPCGKRDISKLERLAPQIILGVFNEVLQ